MPELPEVQAVVDSLQQLKNQTICTINIVKPVVLPEKEIFIKKIINKNIIDISRRGKYIIFKLNSGYIIGHLRMTGKIYIKNDFEYKKHTHVIIKTDKYQFVFEDTRRFGKLEWVESLDFLEKKLGLEPFDKNLDNIFFSKIKKNKPIKAVLLDQTIIAGIGNIYADEILFASKISPKKIANKLTLKEADLILENTRIILAEAIKHKGTTVINFSYGGEEIGNFFKKLKVYGRKNLKCLECSRILIAIKVTGRTTVYCVNCQFGDL